MYNLNIHSYECAELVHAFCEVHEEEYSELWETENISELEFVMKDFSVFQDFARDYGYNVVL